MENASKALIMAAGVLIGLLILSLAVYLFVSFGSTASEIYQKNEENQLNKFNVQFTYYVGKDLTIYDVITIVNRATENNVFYEFKKRNEPLTGNDNYIGVVFYGQGRVEEGYGGIAQEQINQKHNTWIERDIGRLENTGKLPKYTCTVLISQTTQRVYSVTINLKN